MPDLNDPFSANIPAPTAQRPLLGLTVLVIEDSRFACEAMRLLCLRSGARIRRADCIRSARRHLQVYCPSITIIDLGLPDGDGIDLIAELAQAPGEFHSLLAMSGDAHREAEAMAAGAHAFLPKPITSLATFQETVLALVPSERRPSGFRVLTDEVVVPDPIAFHDDIAHIVEFLEDPPDDRALDYAAQFLSGVARSADDTRLETAAIALSRKRALGLSANSEVADITGLIQQRLMRSIAI